MASGATQVITKARGPQRGPVIAPWADRKSRTSTRFVIWQSLGSITALVSFSSGTVTQEKPSAKHSNGKTCTSARRRPDKSLLSKKQINKTQKLQYRRPIATVSARGRGTDEEPTSRTTARGKSCRLFGGRGNSQGQAAVHPFVFVRQCDLLVTSRA